MTRDSLGALLHEVVAARLPRWDAAAVQPRLRHPAERAAWEAAFAASAAPLFTAAGAPAAAAAALAARAPDGPGEEGPGGGGALRDALAEAGPGWASSWRPDLLRCTTPARDLAAAAERALAALGGGGGCGRGGYPLLRALLRPDADARLALAALLVPISAWLRAFAAAAAEARLTRAAAFERDVAWLLATAPGLTSVYEAAAAALGEAEAAFAGGLGVGCEALPPIGQFPSGGAGVRLALFCAAPAGAGAPVVALAAAVARHHNAVLAELRAAAATSPALAHLALQPRAVRLADFVAADLVELAAVDVAAALRDASRPGVGRGPGAGLMPRFDAAVAERALAAPLARAAEVASVERGSEAGAVEAFTFAGEAFRGRARTLAALRARVPQAIALPSGDALRASLAAAPEADAHALLAALGAAAHAAAAALPPPDALAAGLATGAGLAAADVAALARLPPTAALRCGQLEAAYLIVEEAVATGLFDAIDGAFKALLPAGGAAALASLTGCPPRDAAGAVAAADAAAGAALALRRFAARYLAHEAHFDTPTAPLSAFDELVPWPPVLCARGAVCVDEGGLQLRHTHAAVLELDRMAAEARVAATRRTAAPTARGATGAVQGRRFRGI